MIVSCENSGVDGQAFPRKLRVISGLHTQQHLVQVIHAAFREFSAVGDDVTHEIEGHFHIGLDEERGALGHATRKL